MDNSPEAVKGRVRSMTKAIRYKARKEGNLMKEFNDYMGSQSGISATERAAVKSSLGLSENKWRTLKSDWRSDLVEVSAMTDDMDSKKIKEKKVKNKIVINPTLGMKEAFEEIGGTIVEVVELTDETDRKKEELLEKSREKDIEQGRVPGRLGEAMSPKEIQLQKRRSQIDMMIARDRKRQISKVANAKNQEAPTRPVGEGYAPGDIDQKVGAVTAIPKKEQDAARARILAKAKAKREARMKEDIDNVDEMYKGKHGQTEKQYQDSRSDAGKMVSGDSKMSGAAYSSRSMRGTGPNPAGGSKKPEGQGRMTSGARTDLKFRKAALKKRMEEETEDSLRDKRQMYGGVDGNVDYSRPPAAPNLAGKKKSSGKSALDIVKAQIRAKHGKGAIMDTKK